jgi:hypothetical protein
LPSRRVYIPKPDGRQRPLAVAALEDKIVQRALAALLNAIYEEDFLGFSYGFRPERGAHDAMDALCVVNGNIFNSKGVHVANLVGREIFDLSGKKLYDLGGSTSTARPVNWSVISVTPAVQRSGLTVQPIDCSRIEYLAPPSCALAVTPNP